MNNIIIRRAKAFFTDVMIIGLFMSPLNIYYTFNFDEFLKLREYMITLAYLTTYLPLFLYFFISEYFYLRTFGKRIMKIKVVELEPKRNRFLTILLRTIFRFVPLDFLSFIFSIENNFWHDIVSKTRVVENE